MPTSKALAAGGKSFAVAGTVLMLVAVGAAVYLATRTSSTAPTSGGAAAAGTSSQPPSSGVSASPTVPAPTRSASASPVVTAASGAWPNPANTGVPAGWTPASTRTSDLRVTTKGAVVKDIRLVRANLVIAAENVTVQRVELQGGSIINDPGPRCANGLVVENVSIVRAAGLSTSDGDLPAIQAGGYTARRVKIDGRPEGFRVGGKSVGCGKVTIIDSFARVTSPDKCTDWHGDGIQGYDGPALVARNVTLEMVETGGCGGTAPFFYPDDQGNTTADIDRMLVKGGGYPFRMMTPGSVRGLKVVDGSWEYGPIDAKCSRLSVWQAHVVTVNADYQPTRTVRSIPCTTP